MKHIMILLLALSFSASALTLPSGIYKDAHVTPESDYTIFELMRDARKLFHKGKMQEATPLFIRALLKAKKNQGEKNIDQYDYLYAHHGLLSALSNDDKKEKEYVKLSKKILRYLDKSTDRGIWEEGDLGKFQMFMYKIVGNKLATILYKQSERKNKKKMQEALHYIKKAEQYIRSDRDFYIKETKAKIVNALEGNKPLADEKPILKVTKIIKKKKDDK